MYFLYFLGGIAIGVYCIMGAVKEWSIFMNNRKLFLLKKIFGNSGVKIFYILFGIIFIVMGFVGGIYGILK